MIACKKKWQQKGGEDARGYTLFPKPVIGIPLLWITENLVCLPKHLHLPFSNHQSQTRPKAHSLIYMVLETLEENKQLDSRRHLLHTHTHTHMCMYHVSPWWTNRVRDLKVCVQWGFWKLTVPEVNLNEVVSSCIYEFMISSRTHIHEMLGAKEEN